MATIWARSNGNWNGSIWNWDNNGTIEAYPYSIPQANDIVYSNGYTVALNVSLISCATLTNRLNPYTNRRGGYFSTTGNISVGFNCNLLADSTYLINFNTTSDKNWSLNGNIEGGEVYTGEATNCVIYKASSNTNALVVNGNVDGRNSNAIFGGNGAALIPYTINGNVTINYKLSVGLNINRISEINGNFTKLTDGDFQTGGTIGANNGLVVRGDVYGDMTFGSIKSTITIGGDYYYLTSFKVPLNKLVATYPQSIIYRYVGTEPNPNPYLVINPYTGLDYPPERDVKKDVEYAWGEKVGTYEAPPESVVLKGFVYDNGDKIGSLENQNIVGCVTKEDVRKGVELIGLQEVGTLVVPSVDDVREGVHFDNDSVGTLIVQGGGDRLRIADFGYYTRSTSITYIVDLTESDKPAFADCEEIVLRLLFPTLDLNNIPDKFFDDLFVQFLRYRLLVEYYRGTSINSKFTPSEPTAEIVNYANTKCEYWLNTANLFLQLWGEKYPNSIKKQRILL